MANKRISSVDGPFYQGRRSVNCENFDSKNEMIKCLENTYCHLCKNRVSCMTNQKKAIIYRRIIYVNGNQCVVNEEIEAEPIYDRETRIFILKYYYKYNILLTK